MRANALIIFVCLNLAVFSYGDDSAYSFTGYYSGLETVPYTGVSYDTEFNDKHFARYSDLTKIADPETFRVVGSIYAVDKNHVFMENEIINEADPKSFVEMTSSLNNSEYYAKDHQYVYVRGKIIPDADPSTFRLIAKNYNTGHTYVYAKDKNAVYVRGKKIEGADPNTFVFYSSVVGMDQRSVYYLEHALTNSDPKTFKESHNQTYFMDNDIFQDAKQVYYKSSVASNLNPESFVILSDKYMKDDQMVVRQKYGTWEVLENIDIASFSIIGQANDRGKTVHYFMDKDSIFDGNGDVLAPRKGQKIQYLSTSDGAYLKLDNMCYEYNRNVDCRTQNWDKALVISEG